MSETPFSPETRRALDSFLPPSQPAGFAERALEKVRQRESAAAPSLPRLSRRWRSANPWRRAGWIVGGVASLSLMSAAAAATGVFGEPVHVPLISQIAQSLEIVPVPTASSGSPNADRAVAKATAAGTGASSVREQLDTLLDDPEFRALPPRQRRVELRQTARELVGSGEATPREVVTALRETARERVAALPLEQRQQIEDAVAERREARREVLAEAKAERPQVRRQVIRERLSDLRERRAQRLQQQAAGEPEGVPVESVENSAPSAEGSDAAIR
jgi:hypothetical protein